DKSLTCKFYVLGLHDNYLIESGGQKYILRIYRNNWRTEEEILFELEWLVFLNSKTNLVAKLIETKKGNLTVQIDSPEGLRLASMFRYADGNAPENTISAKEAELLGETVSYIHEISDVFVPQRTRQVLDIPYLLDGSLSDIKPYLESDGLSYLCNLREQLNISMPKLDKASGIYGLCMGDVNPTNFHIDKNNKITVFDFDQCGYGYRAFEIGKFFSSIRNHNEKQEIQEAFLKGYQCIRPLSRIEQEAIPIFEIISVIWVMAIQAVNADRIGYKYLEKQSWDRRLNDLKKLVSALRNKASKPTPKSSAAEL
ncbi:MAG: phosphotransferase, partial [Gammaproteobacteria bacterium]|nr:phosphotransferase [Gammaproteobacteria bacterium]